MKTMATPTAEEIRREFAAAWGEIGAAWGVAPSTAAVQGYLLVHPEPLTEPEIRRALGLSHRATSLALAQCEEWGVLERAAPRRSGRRGPAAAAYVVVGDHWNWFRHVAAARRERETVPVIPAIERCVALAAGASGGDAELADLAHRLRGLLRFAQLFDRGVADVVRADPRAIERLFEVVGRLDEATVERLWHLIEASSADEIAAALRALSRMPPAAAHRLMGLARLAGR
jgi:DNA-binding transcriptional regulator GbsR (MarR family)